MEHQSYLRLSAFDDCLTRQLSRLHVESVSKCAADDGFLADANPSTSSTDSMSRSYGSSHGSERLISQPSLERLICLRSKLHYSSDDASAPCSASSSRGRPSLDGLPDQVQGAFDVVALPSSASLSRHPSADSEDFADLTSAAQSSGSLLEDDALPSADDDWFKTFWEDHAGDRSCGWKRGKQCEEDGDRLCAMGLASGGSNCKRLRL